MWQTTITTRDRPPTTPLRLSRVAVIIILIVTALPAGLRDPRTIYWEFIFTFPDAVGNVLLYLPFGFFLQSTSSLKSVARYGTGLSLSIELAQLFFVRRNPQPLDVLFNVIGAVCGALLGRLFNVRADRIELGRGPGLVAFAIAAIWATSYLWLWKSLPPFTGRGSVAVVAFLCAIGISGILKPSFMYSRYMAAVLGGAIGAAVLAPASSISVLSTFAIGVLFGGTVVYCTHEP
jgi:VanZ family protein